jgi:hypothetical protein
MIKHLSIAWFALAACAQSDTLVDAGAVCVGRTFTDDSPIREPNVVAGEPIPLVFNMSGGCTVEFEDAACMVDLVDQEAIVSTIVTIRTPGRPPWVGLPECGRLMSIACEMPPATEGVTTIRYGDESMDITVPSQSDQCVQGVSTEL